MTRIPRRIWVLILLILIGIAPVISVALAGLIASANDCDLHEGFIQPCVVLGRDIGGLLYTMTVMGWLMLISAFFFMGGVLGLLIEAARFIIGRFVRG